MADPKKQYVPPTGGLGPPIPTVTPGKELPELPDLRVFPNQPSVYQLKNPEVSPQEEAFTRSLEEPNDEPELKWKRIPGVGVQMADGTIVTDEGNIIQPNVDVQGGRVHGMVLPSEREHPRINPPEVLTGTPSPKPGEAKPEEPGSGALSPPQQPYTPGGMAIPAPGPPAAAATPAGGAHGPGHVAIGGVVGSGGPPFGTLDKEDEAYLEKVKDYQNALSSASSAETDRAIGTSQYVREHVASLEDLQKIQKSFREQSLAEVEALDAKNQALAKQAAAEKIDPEHYWNTKGTGTKIAMALSMALGEFGSHMPHVSGGGQNLAAQLIQSAIQRDVESQKDNIANKWKAVSAGTDLVKNKIAEGNFVADQMDKESSLANHKLIVQLQGLQLVADSAEKKAKIASIIADAQNNIRQIKENEAMRRYQFRNSLLAGQAMQIQQQRKAYEELKTKLYEKNAEARAKSETEAPIPSLGEYMGTSYTGKAGGSVVGAVPERDRAAVNKERENAEIANQAVEVGKTIKSPAFDITHPTTVVNPLLRQFSQTEAGANAEKIDQVNMMIDDAVKRIDSMRMPEEEKTAAKSRIRGLHLDNGMPQDVIDRRVEAIPKVVGATVAPLSQKYGLAPPAPPPPLPGEKQVK